MRSIRARLTLYLLSGLAVLITVAGLALEVRIGRWLEREFDRALEAKARALVTLTKQENGEVELDFADEFMPEFESPTDSQYFELWLDGDHLLERSNSFRADPTRIAGSLRRKAVPQEAPRFEDVVLPDGRSGRQIQIDFVPQVEDDDDGAAVDERHPRDEVRIDPSNVESGSGLHRATVLVGRERQGLDRQLAELRWSLFAFIGLLLLAVGAIIALTLKVGLRPLDRLARQVHDLEADSLDRRVDLQSPPLELRPIVSQINELLSRLEVAFRRERQLTSDIAHELRTPIAELRNLCEVGARWPDDAVTARGFFEDAWTIGLQMERIVGHLLALARYDEGALRPQLREVELAGLLSEAWRPLEAEARARGLTLRNEVPAGAALETDPERMRLILGNLLSNAVHYSRAETAIRCRFEGVDGRASLTISNYTSLLEPDDLGRMFDRFWRKDEARTGERSVGLGLAIVSAFSDLLDLEIATDLEPDGRFQVTLQRTN